MAWRFRKIFSTKGARANVSKSGISLSFGGPGASVNVGRRGVKVTGGLPGTGLSASHTIGAKGRGRGRRREADAEPMSLGRFAGAFLIYPGLFLVILAIWNGWWTGAPGLLLLVGGVVLEQVIDAQVAAGAQADGDGDPGNED